VVFFTLPHPVMISITAAALTITITAVAILTGPLTAIAILTAIMTTNATTTNATSTATEHRRSFARRVLLPCCVRAGLFV
jgi:hypothetical protein